MMPMDPMQATVSLPRRAFRAGMVCLLLALPLSGCISLFSKPEDLIHGSQAVPATVDPGTAAREISAYRQSRGLSLVTLDPKLMVIASRHSQAMARTGKMAHVVRGEGSFERRLTAGGYDASIAAENVAAGHRNLDEALAGWKASPGHNANLLKPGVTQMGIAVAFSPNSKYGNFWTVVLATPDTRRAAFAPQTGSVVAAPR